MASSKRPTCADLASSLEQFLDRLPAIPGRLAVGLSGGLDSVVLLDLLANAAPGRGIVLSAVHVHHGLSPQADAWAEFCRQLCRGYGIPCRVRQVSVPRDSGLGTEAAARAARYAALLAEDCDALALAHHRDDQAETLLLQLLRGAGLPGLSAMPEQRPLAGRQLLRPLLDLPRSRLAAYAAERGLRWVEDESNLDTGYDRNFLRHDILPRLESRFPAARQTLARSAAHLAEAAELLQQYAEQDLARCVVDGRLDLGLLASYAPARARHLLRCWLAPQLRHLPSTHRLQDIQQQLLGARPDAQLRIVLEGRLLRRYRGWAWLAPAEAGEPQQAIWQGEASLPFGGGTLRFSNTTGGGLSLARLGGEPLLIRTRMGGESLRPQAGRPRRSLKYLLQQAAVPPWQRPRLPLVYWRGRLVAVPGIAVDSDLQAGKDEQGLLVSWQA